MFSTSFTMSKQEHRQWTPYKLAEVCDEHADLIKHERRRSAVRDFRGS
jgi:hypothetical protein